MLDIRLNDPVEHDADKREVNSSLGMKGFDFAVAHQSAMFHQPAERALDDPAFGQDDKTFYLAAGHNLDWERTAAAMCCNPMGKTLSRVASSTKSARRQHHQFKSGDDHQRAPWRSDTLAGLMDRPKSRPSVCTRMWRLIPWVFLAAS